MHNWNYQIMISITQDQKYVKKQLSRNLQVNCIRSKHNYVNYSAAELRTFT